MSTCDRNYEQGVGSLFAFMVEGRSDVDERWTSLSCCDTRVDAQRRMLQLAGGPYKDLRIVRRALL